MAVTITARVDDDIRKVNVKALEEDSCSCWILKG